MNFTKTFAAVVALGMVAFAPSAQAADKTDSLTFTVVKSAPITSVKNQSRSGTCWCFSTLGYFESEILRKTGKTYDLSEAFVINHTMVDRAETHIRTHGDVSFSQGGSFYDVLYCAKTYGLAPESATVPAGSLYGDSLFSHSAVEKLTQNYLKGITGEGAPKTVTPVWKSIVSGYWEAYLGKNPTEFTYEGKSYTPQTFAASLGLDWDDYISLTSFSHKPFYSQYVIEVQDNWRWATSYNLPLNEFMECMDYALRNGHTFAWGADVSETYFSRKGSSVATVPVGTKRQLATEGSDQERWIGKQEKKNKTAEVNGLEEMVITQELRQQAYDNWETTDDHGMVIYGIAKDQYGKEYYMMKNSWGNYNKFGGCAYISKAYMAYKTMNIMINKKAIPAEIAKKLGIQQ